MSRLPVTFDMSRAHQIHDVLSGVIPEIGQPRPHNPLGVVAGSVFPTVVPVEEVIRGTTYVDVASAVYIVTDDNRAVRYVGSIDRSSPALKSRLAAHLRHGEASRTGWTGVGLVRVPNGFAHRKVLLCEGWVGRVLDPLDNDRLPLVGGRSWTPRRRAA